MEFLRIGVVLAISSTTLFSATLFDNTSVPSTTGISLISEGPLYASFSTGAMNVNLSSGVVNLTRRGIAQAQPPTQPPTIPVDYPARWAPFFLVDRPPDRSRLVSPQEH